MLISQPWIIHNIMWATTSTQTPIAKTPFFSFSKFPQPSPAAVQVRWRNRHHKTIATAAASSEEISGLGQAVLNAIKSSPSTGSNPNKKVQQKQEDKPNKRRGKEDNKKNYPENEISGSDILRALQRANAKNAKTKKQQQVNKGSGPGDLKKADSNEKKRIVDYDEIRPLTIKSDWAARFNDLEKRLQEFLPY